MLTPIQMNGSAQTAITTGSQVGYGSIAASRMDSTGFK